MTDNHRKKRKDAHSYETLEQIETFHRNHNKVSPNQKDVIRRYVGPKQFEKRRIIYRDETWNEFWLGSLPRSLPGFAKAAPFELIAGKEQGCLCTNCEGLEQFRHGQTAVVSALLDKDN